MQIYTTEKLGATQGFTPEGFLLCADVPIARTGEMIYGEDEIAPGPGEQPLLAVDGLIRVTRYPDEVFRPETMSSFEGKPVTDDHPDSVMVNASNWRKLAVGVVQNVRRGIGIHDQCIVADLLIQDQDAIDAVRAGKREVSCGYRAEYQQDSPGVARQVGIVGNHVALVEQGRCGPKCSIGDGKMAAKKVSWMDRVRGAFRAKDESLLEEALEMAGSEEGDRHNITVNVNGVTNDKKTRDDDVSEMKDEDPEEKKKDTDDKLFKPILDKLTAIDTRLGAVESFVKDAKSKDEDEPEKKDEKKEDTKDCDDPDSVKDSDEPDDKEEKKTDDKKKTKDAAYVPAVGAITKARSEWQDTLSRAEILMPGVRLPTFDAALPQDKATDALCAFRRRTVLAAFETDRGREAIRPFVDGDAPQFKSMTCDAVRILFVAASDRAKGANMVRGGFAAPAKGRGLPSSNSEINAINAAFYGKK